MNGQREKRREGSMGEMQLQQVRQRKKIQKKIVKREDCKRRGRKVSSKRGRGNKKNKREQGQGEQKQEGMVERKQIF